MKTKGEGRIGRIGARNRLLTAVCTLCFSAAVFSSTVYAGTEGTWERTEDGKYWKYVYAPDRQAIDEWIEIDGKEYYFDKKGRMKTGWVTSEWDGNRYYMGKDGAKCRSTFLSNGTYIGPDGVVLERFEAWRKAVQNQLEQMVRAKTEGVFFLTDLNGDGYRDLAVLNRLETPDQLYLAALWDEETDTLHTISESGLEEDRYVYLTVNDKSTWLITQQKETLERDYFELGEDWDYFEHQRHFMAEKNDWGDLIYFADGEEKQKEEWNELLKEADVLAGAENGYFPSAAQKESACSLDKDSIKTALLQPPTAEEAALWQP